MLSIVKDKKTDQSTDNKVNELNYDMDDDHHDEDISLEDVEIGKDITDSTAQQEEPEKIQNDGATDTHPMPLQQQLQQQEKKDQSLY